MSDWLSEWADEKGLFIRAKRILGGWIPSPFPTPVGAEEGGKKERRKEEAVRVYDRRLRQWWQDGLRIRCG